jgi:hypothetical protein
LTCAMDGIGASLSVSDRFVYVLEVGKILCHHQLSVEGRMVYHAVDDPICNLGFLVRFVLLWQQREVIWKQFHIGEAAFQCFLAAEQNNQLARFDPFLDFLAVTLINLLPE